MHEVGFVQSILEVAERQTRAADATCIHVIRLRIGRLTGVVPEAIEHAFAVLRTGTMAATADLEFDYVPAVCWCDACEQEFAADSLYSDCPRCGAPSLIVRQGQEMELLSLEVS